MGGCGGDRGGFFGSNYTVEKPRVWGGGVEWEGRVWGEMGMRMRRLYPVLCVFFKKKRKEKKCKGGGCETRTR